MSVLFVVTSQISLYISVADTIFMLVYSVYVRQSHHNVHCVFRLDKIETHRQNLIKFISNNEPLLPTHTHRTLFCTWLVYIGGIYRFALESTHSASFFIREQSSTNTGFDYSCTVSYVDFLCMRPSAINAKQKPTHQNTCRSLIHI